MAEISLVELSVYILYGMLTGFLFIIGTDILGRYLKADKQQRGDAVHLTFFVIGLGIIGYGCYMTSVIVGRILIPDSNFIFSFQMLVLVLFLSAFAFTAEQFVLSRKRRIFRIGKRKFGGIGLLASVMSVYAIVLLVSEILGNLEQWVYFPIMAADVFFGIVGFYGFVMIFLVRLSLAKEIKRKILFGLVSGCIALGGEIISLLGRNPPDLLWVVGTMIEIGGWLFFRYFFLSIPPYSELDWKNGIIEIHVIMADTGLSLFYRLFHRISPEALKGELKVTTTLPEHTRPDSDLTGGAMIGIKGLLNEITGTKGKLRNIVIGEKNLIFNQANCVMVLLLADQNLGVYHSLLYQIAQDIEEENPHIANFNGNLKTLHIAPVIDRYFGSIQTENNSNGK
jgi:hypothetical protein